MAKTKQRYVSNEEFLREKQRAQSRFAESRNEYFRRHGQPLYAETAAVWHKGKAEAYIAWEADRRKRLNAEILTKVKENTKPYGVCRERGEVTRAERDIIEAIFTLAKFSCDLYAAVETVAHTARRSIKMVKIVRQWLEDAGLLVRVHTGGQGRDKNGWGITSRFQIRYDRFRELYGIKQIRRLTMKEICDEFNAAVAEGKKPPRRTRMGLVKEKGSWKDFFKGIQNKWAQACGKLGIEEGSDQQFYPLYSLTYNKIPITAFPTKSFPQPNTRNSPKIPPEPAPTPFLRDSKKGESTV